MRLLIRLLQLVRVPEVPERDVDLETCLAAWCFIELIEYFELLVKVLHIGCQLCNFC